MAMTDDAEERKRKRLEAWRKRQQSSTPVVKVTLSLGTTAKKAKPKSRVSVCSNPFGEGDEDEELPNRKSMGFHLDDDKEDGGDDSWEQQVPVKKRRRWDSQPEISNIGDALDKFMEKLEADDTVTTQETSLSIDISGSMMRPITSKIRTPLSGGVITPEQLQQLSSGAAYKTSKDPDALYSASDWESDAQGNSSEPETDDDEEQQRRKLIEALKSAPGPTDEGEDVEVSNRPAQLAAEVKTEKQRREERFRELEREAEAAKRSAASESDFGRLYNDGEGGVMEEAERNLDAAMGAPDALEVLAELNKKKELKAVDHSKVDYIPFNKNLYIVPRSLAALTPDEVADRRAKLKVKVRGQGAPAPVSSFEECGLSERLIGILEKQDIKMPFPVQAQCIPCIMAGRDVIGIAKTGSGKTLAYLLPLLRHISDQPPLGPQESGPIGLILAPARELASQIHSVCKFFSKHLNLKSTAVYGGAAVAEQIGELKRGVHIAVATPGRLIDILTMQSGKLLSLQRVSFIVLDEADRMFDMGFAPQISAIISAVRPDRQTVLFSATFPKTVEQLARKSLLFPIEVLVGGRSVASDNVTQFGEVVEEEDKFLRLLQLLGEHVDEGKKVIVFVDTQVKADNVFEQLLRCGYVSLSLHGGKEQEDRDSTISDFKRKDGPLVLVATGVAGRGLDVPSCGCVINFSPPNHLEAYVHQVGRTGRAAAKGFAFTFVNSTDEAKYAPIIVRALSEAGQSENIQTALKELSTDFKEKVNRGEAKYAGSGFKGKGYSYDSNELSDAQKLARAERRQALIEAGLLDADDDDPCIEADKEKPNAEADKPSTAESREKEANIATAMNAAEMQKLTPELMLLPGMREAILRKAGILKDDDDELLDPGSKPVQMGPSHYLQEVEINDYPREARWKVTQKETTSRLQFEFQTAVTLKGSFFGPGRTVGDGERKLYLHLEAKTEQILKNCVLEIRRLLNEETLRVSARQAGGGVGVSSHKYSVLS